MKKIRVIHFVSGLQSGGVESMIVNYAKILNKDEEFEFTVAYQHEPEQKCYQKMKEAGCSLVRIPSKKKHLIKNIICINNLLSSGKFDVVHSHMNLTSWLPLLIARIHKIKMRINHAHIAKDEGEGLIYGLFALISKQMIKVSANYFLACGEDAGRYMYGKNFCEGGKYLIIKNAIDIEKFRFSITARNDYRKKFCVKDEMVIGHIGRFTRQKNHFFLIDIFKETLKEKNNMILWLIGNGELEKEVKKYVAEIGIEDKVRFFGSRNDVACLLQAMDIFLLPSLFEGLPVVSIEAQASGLQCLLADTIDSTCKITDNVEFLPINCGEKLWKEKILKMNILNKREKSYIQVIENGYDIRKQIKKLRELYLEVKEYN